MFHRKFNSICFIALSIILSDCLAQLTFHNDALMNSFTLKAPGVQQSFTRYFGGKRTGSLLQAAAPQHQYQQPQLQPNSLLQQQQQQPQQYSQYQQQLLRQPFAYTQPQQFSRYSASTRYQQPSTSGSAAGSFPFESDFQQPLPQSVGNYASYQPAAASYAPPQMAAYAPQQQQQVEYRTISQPISQSLAPAYADQLQQMNDSYQQEQLQAQQMQAQQQRQQEQLLMDLYKQTPQGQGRAVTESPGRSQAFYTADQYINFLNRQHQDVFSQQQNQADNRGFQFSPMSAYSPSGVPATTTSAQYSPASNVSHVNYSNGKLSYNY